MSSNYLLILLLIINAGISVLRGMSLQNIDTVNFVYVLINDIVIAGWLIFHAREHEIKPPYINAIFAGLFPPIGIPVYFYRKFGFKFGSLKVLKAIAFLFVLIFVSTIFENREAKQNHNNSLQPTSALTHLLV